MTVAAVVWDMDGTLVDSADVVPAAFVETVRRLGAPPVTAERVVELYAVGRPMHMLDHMLGRPGTQDDEDLYHRVLAEMGSGVRVHDGIAETLEQLAGQGLRLAVFTGNSHPAAEVLLAAAGLREHFEAVVGGDEIAHAKPAPDGVLEAARRLGLPPASCAYVGDSPVDVTAGAAAGAVAVAAGWGHLFDPARDLEHASAVAAEPADVVRLLGR